MVDTEGMQSRRARPGRDLAVDLIAGPQTRPRVAARALLFMAIYVLAAQVTLMSRSGDGQFGLIWPSGGVATLWLLTANRFTVRSDIAALTVGAVIGSLLSDSDPVLTVARVVANVSMALVFRVMVDWWTPLRRPDDSLRRLTRLPTLYKLAGAAALAALVQVSITESAAFLTGEPNWPEYVLRWGRNVVAIFTMTTTGLLLLGLVTGPSEPEDEADPSTRDGYVEESVVVELRLIEVVLLTLFTLFIFVPCFLLFPQLPLSFLLFLPSIWAGVRFSPPFAAVHALALGATAMWLTLQNVGMYAEIVSPVLRASVAQAFLGVVFATTVIMSMFRTQLETARLHSLARTRLLDSILTSVDDGIALVEESGRVLMLNRAVNSLLGLPEDFASLTELDAASFYTPDGTPVDLTRPYYVVRALAGEQVAPEDFVVRPPDGSAQRVLRITAQQMEVPERARPQVLFTVHNVTAERAQRAALASFAGQVAHDLKNPLTVVEGWSELLEGELRAAPELDSAEGLPMVLRIQSAAAHMRTLITELLTYTLARDHALSRERVDLAEVVTEVAKLHEEPAMSKGGTPIIEIDCHHTVWADRMLVGQVLDNLVGNSVKYVAPQVRPHVWIDSHLVPAPAGEEARGDLVEIRVSDNGLGVPEADRDQIFQSFYRVDRPGYSGTGLGLAICQRIVERHGGTITVTTGPGGVGSTFAFTLPAAGE